MSLVRGVYYSAVLAAWAALLGVFVCQATVLRLPLGGSVASTAVVGAVIGLFVGAGLGLTAGAASGSAAGVVRRAAVGGLIGAAGGAVGGVVGELLFALSDKLRPVGWMVLGVGVGVADGLFDRSAKKVRNGLIGGGLGGLAGGFAFDLISRLAGGSEFAGRAAGFVLLGLCVGAMIGLVQLLLRQAWLTVVDGFGIGRQVILARSVTPLGRTAADGLSFGGRFGQDLAGEHATVRASGGRYELCPAAGTSGTAVNGQAVAGPVSLRDGDIIRLGSNYIRFSERSKSNAPPAPPVAPRPVVAPAPRPKVLAADPPAAKKPPLVVTAATPAPPRPVVAPATPAPVVKAAPPPPAPTAPPGSARCPDCGGPVSGKPGLRMCKQCGAMS